MIKTVDLKTTHHTEFLSVTSLVEETLKASEKKDGVCHLFVQHTTAGLTINENADPDVKADIIETLEKLVPWHKFYRHTEGNSAGHIKASLMGFSLTIPVKNGRLQLGTWQDVYFCEFDGPRNRCMVVTFE